MTNSNETSQEEYDEILRKLDILLSRHQSRSSVPPADTDGGTTAPPARFSRIASKQTPAADVNIPTLTEVVHSAPSTLCPADLTILLEQILDSALGDAQVDLNPEARKALVQALESRLFGLQS